MQNNGHYQALRQRGPRRFAIISACRCHRLVDRYDPRAQPLEVCKTSNRSRQRPKASKVQYRSVGLVKMMYLRAARDWAWPLCIHKTTSVPLFPFSDRLCERTLQKREQSRRQCCGVLPLSTETRRLEMGVSVNQIIPLVLVVVGNRDGHMGQQACGIARSRHPRRSSSTTSTTIIYLTNH